MREISIGSSPTAGSSTTLYTVPTGYRALWVLYYVHNTGSNTKTFTLQWYDSSANATYDILNGDSFTAKETLQVSGSYIVLEEGDQVKVTPEASSTFTVILTLELMGNQRA